mmetsp:Transcript_11087/g.20065  ORF Transcript_11087/g.20065 Transcript_11087/m.20065 type:complete len:305 (+) Transcript_11087:300-1214(+)
MSDNMKGNMNNNITNDITNDNTMNEKLSPKAPPPPQTPPQTPQTLPPPPSNINNNNNNSIPPSKLPNLLARFPRAPRLTFSDSDLTFLTKLVETHGPKNWSFLSNSLNSHNSFTTSFTAKSTNEVYHSRILHKPTRSEFTLSEDTLLTNSVKKIGNKWKLISLQFPSRTRKELSGRYAVLKKSGFVASGLDVNLRPKSRGCKRKKVNHLTPSLLNNGNKKERIEEVASDVLRSLKIVKSSINKSSEETTEDLTKNSDFGSKPSEEEERDEESEGGNKFKYVIGVNEIMEAIKGSEGFTRLLIKR